MRRRLSKALIITVVGAFCVWLTLKPLWQPEEAALYALQGNTMGTTWSLQLYIEAGKAGPEQLRRLNTDVQQMLQRLDKDIFSSYSPQSELNRFNSAATGSPILISAELFDVLDTALQVHKQSHGAFDPTIGPLVNLWGFGAAGSAAVSDASIQGALLQMGAHKLQLAQSPYTATKLSALTLDLSAIAKGYATDQLAEYLLAQGYSNFLVEIGGEIRVQGNKAASQSWLLAIEKPLSGRREAQFTLNTRGRALALAGSGDYRNFKVIDGQRYSHEIDPRSGYPVSHQLAAVTVISESAMLADAWATALMILGPESGLLMADGLGLSAYFIIRSDEGFRTTYSGAFAEYAEYIEP